MRSSHPAARGVNCGIRAASQRVSYSTSAVVAGDAPAAEGPIELSADSPATYPDVGDIDEIEPGSAGFDGDGVSPDGDSGHDDDDSD